MVHITWHLQKHILKCLKSHVKMTSLDNAQLKVEFDNSVEFPNDFINKIDMHSYIVKQIKWVNNNIVILGIEEDVDYFESDFEIDIDVLNALDDVI
jgi:hypothetical protein